ncbi:MAG: hypothetical protein J6B87_06450 [Clostridia bacterium]|nr:hypothetical protein [Clostridia bacterium]
MSNKTHNTFKILKNIAKILNIIANILLIPFVIFFAIVSLLISAGIKESKTQINKR